VVRFADFIHREDIRVIERRRGFGFTNKTIQLLRIFAEFLVREFLSLTPGFSQVLMRAVLH